jgi:hypothetical protein
MRAMLLATIAATSFGFAGITHSAAGPANGMAIENAFQGGLLTTQIDCRRYPHRHQNARPHGFGFGCPKKAPRAKTKTKRSSSTWDSGTEPVQLWAQKPALRIRAG